MTASETLDNDRLGILASPSVGRGDCRRLRWRVAGYDGLAVVRAVLSDKQHGVHAEQFVHSKRRDGEPGRTCKRVRSNVP